MGKIIAVANQKGGVAKTTTAVNLSAALHSLGKKILLVDLDPQGNACSGMGVSKGSSPNTYEMLMKGVPAEEAVFKTEFGDIIPSGKDLAAASLEMTGMDGRESVLKKALLPVKMDYDFIFIDCPPSLELITVNALVAADSVLIPMQCEYYALEGITDLLTSIKLTNRKLNRGLEIEGIVLTMFDGRMNLTNQVAAELRKYLGSKVYDTVIPRSIRLSEAPSHGLPGVVYDRTNKGSRAYMELAKEFLQKNEGRKG